MKHLIVTYILSVAVLFVCGQNQFATIEGKVSDEYGKALSYVTVSSVFESVFTNEKGMYSMQIPKTDTLTLFFSHIGYSNHKKTLTIKQGTNIYSVVLTRLDIEIPKVQVIYNKEVEEKITYLSSEKTRALTGISMTGIEGSIKTLPGVSSKSELSSQYSVRGGSYDENLVYINGVPVFKPNIASSDQQEGLSIINPYMVGNIEFSSGAFGAQYGDKLSSVLNVNYKDVTEEKIQFDASLLDANLTCEGLADSLGLSYLIGARYKNTSLILDSLDSQGEYKPIFYDIQALLKYSISPKLGVSYWLYGANNTYKFIPDTRTTDFGGLEKQFRMNIYFEGNEQYTYQHIGNALTFHYQPNDRTKLDFTCMEYIGYEKETFDVLGQYRLGEIIPDDKKPGAKSDSIKVLAVGSFLEHGRNSLYSKTFYTSHTGKRTGVFATYQWGITYSHNIYDAIYNEWTYIDSANYALPYSDTAITLKHVKNADLFLIQQTIAAYIQASKRIDFDNIWRSSLKIQTGLRTTYDTYTQSVLYNPRLRLLLKPKYDKNISISAASGVYYQPPQFKELIDENGNIYTDVLPQKSIQYVLGYTQGINIWNRPFVFQTEAYYKQLQHIIPYLLQNVSTVYYPQLHAKGYASGIETKLNGEFVPGVESWISISSMKTMEWLKDSVSDIIRRPNDQHINFAMFFQDYVPGSEYIKMSLTYLFGSRIPTAQPNATYNKFDDFTISPYSRVDLGFLVILTGHKKQISKAIVKNMWLGAEVFNLFDNPNKISYFWIEDVNNTYYGVPNYLTSRRFNIKLSVQL